MLVALDLVNKLLELIFLGLNATKLFSLFLLSGSYILVEQISFPSFLLDVFSVLVYFILFGVKCCRYSSESSFNFVSILDTIVQNDTNLRSFLDTSLIDMLLFTISFF